MEGGALINFVWMLRTNFEAQFSGSATLLRSNLQIHSDHLVGERKRVSLALFSLCIFSEELEMHIWAIKYAGPLRQDDTVKV